MEGGRKAGYRNDNTGGEKSADKLFIVSPWYLYKNKNGLIPPFFFSCLSFSRIRFANGSFLALGISQGSHIRFSHGVSRNYRSPARSLTLAVYNGKRKEGWKGRRRERFPITGTFRSGIPFRTSLFSCRAPRTGFWSFDDRESPIASTETLNSPSLRFRKRIVNIYTVKLNKGDFILLWI